MSKPTPPLTDALRHALSVAMGHPDDWAVMEFYLNFCAAQFGETAPPFVVERISDLDDDYIFCEGYWPNMPVVVEINGHQIVGTINLKWGGNINLEARTNQTVAELLKKSA